MPFNVLAAAFTGSNAGDGRLVYSEASRQDCVSFVRRSYGQNILARQLGIPMPVAVRHPTLARRVFDVIASRAEKEMIRIYARRIIAFVANYQWQFRHVAIVDKKRDAVRSFSLSVHPDEAVAVFVSLPCKLPAPSGGLLHLFKETILQWTFILGKFIDPARAPHLMVVSTAKVASNCTDLITKPATHGISPWFKRDYAIMKE